MHKCWETAHDPSKRTGSIFEPDKLHGSVNASLWSQWTPFDNPVCASCKILPMCGGFCANRSSTAIRPRRRCPAQAGNGIRPNTSSVAPRISASSRPTNGYPGKQP
ncbi:SPASM domain-containing protein [Bradyrhizobium ivorense]|uniref:SPASM domain-containing protein n=1 Tax=Bradyrhizobium ivorense TaxID=2511166 RepID=UPI003557A2F9